MHAWIEWIQIFVKVGFLLFPLGFSELREIQPCVNIVPEQNRHQYQRTLPFLRVPGLLARVRRGVSRCFGQLSHYHRGLSAGPGKRPPASTSNGVRWRAEPGSTLLIYDDTGSWSRRLGPGHWSVQEHTGVVLLLFFLFYWAAVQLPDARETSRRLTCEMLRSGCSRECSDGQRVVFSWETCQQSVVFLPPIS